MVNFLIFEAYEMYKNKILTRFRFFRRLERQLALFLEGPLPHDVFLDGRVKRVQPVVPLLDGAGSKLARPNRRSYFELVL
jgi:hypothetical protein